jgi:hypothetical protein
MDTLLSLLLKSCILVLLPMIPAVIMFKAFPSTTGEGAGVFWGWHWKFGGAFAAYLIVAMLLYVAVKSDLQPRDVEVWTVRGKVEANQVPNIENVLQVRSVPQTLSVEADGSYEMKILVLRSGRELQFPRIFLGLSHGCGNVIPISLDEKAGTFQVLGATRPNVGVKRQNRSRSIDVDTVSLDALSTRKC